MVEVMDKKAHYVAAFEQQEKELAGLGPSWLYQLRKEAMAHFEQIGFPGRRDEEWRFTNIRSVVETPFQRAEPSAQVSFDALRTYAFADYADLLVFVNGHFSPELSKIGTLPSGVKFMSLAQALKTDADSVEPYISRKGSFEKNPFAALNTAFLTDGAFLLIPKGTVVEKPLHVLNFSTSQDQATVSYPRFLIVAGANSQAKVIESYTGPDGEGYLTNAVTEMIVGENAVLDHCRIQREGLSAYHLSATQIHIERSAQFATHSIALGGSITRNDVNALLDAEGIEATINGLYMVAGTQHVDNHTLINHAMPNCNSHELYKGVLDGKGSAVFRGKIYVAKDAQKTDSKQSNNALLLSEGAEINSMPQLEIYADDVKCTHGATTGQLDTDAMFYLRSRGIPQDEAKGLLTYAFASDIIDRIPMEPIQEQLHSLLFERLPLKSYSE